MTYSATVLADTPKAYYRLDEVAGTTAADSSGNGFNGTYTGTYTLGVTGLITGDADKALGLNGAGYVDLGTPNFTFNGGTLEAWIKPTAYQTGAAQFASNSFIIGTSNDLATEVWLSALGDGLFGNEPFFVHSFRETNGLVTYGVHEIPRDKGFVGQVAVHKRGVAGLNNRYHFVAVYDAVGGTAYNYINGYLMTSIPVVNGTIHGNYKWFIGASPQGTLSRWFSGTIDEVAVYDHALTPTRILAHWNAGK